jgi:hypothetical protein
VTTRPSGRRAKRVVWTEQTLDAAIESVCAHLAGEEGEGDMENIDFADLEAARAKLLSMRARLLEDRAARLAARRGAR